MFALLSALLFVVHVSAFQDFDVLVGEFNRWTIQNSKVYSSETEYNYRLAVYAVNKERVKELNTNSNGGAVFGMNKFADLTANEFKAKYLGYEPKVQKERIALDLSSSVNAVPDTYSWISKGKVTAVKDQGQCGSCWAFSATENIESVWMIAKDITISNFKPLAPQQIVDCDTNDSGCNGGDTPTAYEYVKSAGGMDTESSYPYHAVDQSCQFKASDVEAKITGYKYATTSKNEGEMKTATANVAPLSICVDAEPWQLYTGGIMKKAQCAQTLDHCVQITGYDTSASVPYWEVRNSWGTDWGEKGFIRLEYGTNTCGVADEATTAVV